MILPYNLNNIVDKNMTFLPFPFIPTIQFKKHYQTHSRLLLPGFFFKKKRADSKWKTKKHQNTSRSLSISDSVKLSMRAKHRKRRLMQADRTHPPNQSSFSCSNQGGFVQIQMGWSQSRQKQYRRPIQQYQVAIYSTRRIPTRIQSRRRIRQADGAIVFGRRPCFASLLPSMCQNCHR